MKNTEIKILVVEDEVLLIRNIKKKIMEISPEFQVIGEAFDGKEALEIVKQNRPDVVFTDIRMPIMDGLELARILHEEYPEIVTVIVSGYDDFEYARTMLTYRVYDYILKPLQVPVLEKLLFSIKESILKKRREKFLKLLQNQMEGIAVPISDGNLEAELQNTFYFLSLVCFGNLRVHHQITGDEQIPGCSEIQQVVSDEFQVFPYVFGNLCLLIADYSELSCADESNENSFCEYSVESLYDVLKESFPQCAVTLAYRRDKTEYQELHTVTETLYKLLASSLVIGKSSLFECSAEREALPPAILPITSVNHLQVVIASNNTAAFQGALKELFADWHEKQYPQQWIEKVIQQLFNILQRNLYFSEEESDKLFQQVFRILETQNELLEAAENIIPELVQCMVLYQAIPSETENTIEELDTFIRSHYTEYINLAELADKYHFNPSYLTRIFKKQKGEAPLKLINTLRIYDAKELLANPELSVKEISEMIGYSNQHYFSRIFKEFTKQTPKEYRNASEKGDTV